MIEIQTSGPYYAPREHIWRGGWSVRGDDGTLVALCFDKSAAHIIAKMLPLYKGTLPVYGVKCNSEWPEN